MHLLVIFKNGSQDFNPRRNIDSNFNIKISSWKVEMRILNTKEKSFKSYWLTNKNKSRNLDNKKSRFTGKHHKKWWADRLLDLLEQFIAMYLQRKECLIPKNSQERNIQERNIQDKNSQAGCQTHQKTFKNIFHSPDRRNKSR